MEAIIDGWNADGGSVRQQLAYVLATAYHEAADPDQGWKREMQPVREGGRGAGREYGKPDPRTGHAYYGRGLVQITWYDNYDKMGRLLGIDLVNDPDLALEPDVAVKLLVMGMRRGLYTGKKLDTFLPAGGPYRFNEARQIINGMDRADLIAGHAQKFDAALSASQYDA